MEYNIPVCGTFELDKPSPELSVIVTPVGKYKYKHLPMRLQCAGLWIEIMEEVLYDANDTNNIGALSFIY